MVSPVSTARRPSSEAQRVGGVPGRGQHPHLDAGRGDHVALAQPRRRRAAAPGRAPAPAPRSARAARRAPSEWSRWPWVSRIAATAPGGRGDRAQVPASSGPGSTTTARRGAGVAQQPGVGAVQRHRRRVAGQQHRRVRRDRAQLPVQRVAHGWASRSTRPFGSGHRRADRPTVGHAPAGSAARAAAGGQHVGDRAVGRRSPRSVDDGRRQHRPLAAGAAGPARRAGPDPLDHVGLAGHVPGRAGPAGSAATKKRVSYRRRRSTSAG